VFSSAGTYNQYVHHHFPMLKANKLFVRVCPKHCVGSSSKA
jgi:hypothetical protein